MKVIYSIFLFLLLETGTAFAEQAYNGSCQQGGKVATVGGLPATPDVQGSYPTCTVTVYIHSAGLATIYSDNSMTPLANPFTATTDGSFQFYAANGRYDVTMSGGGLPAPVTIFDVLLQDGGGGGSGTVTSVGVSVPTQLTVSGSPVTTSGTIALGLNAPQGNGAKIQLSTGSTTTNDCVKFDAAGNTVDAGTGCGGGGGSGTVTSVGNINLANFSNCTVSNPTTTPTWACTMVTHGDLTAMTDIKIPTTIFSGVTFTSVQGNGPKIQASTGTTTPKDCLVYDANGNAIDGGGQCGIGSYINSFPTSSMKGSLLAAQPFNGSNTQSGLFPLWYWGSSSIVAASNCDANAGNYFLHIGGWLENVSMSISTAMGDGQIDLVQPYMNCVFSGLAGSGLTIPPGSAAGGYVTGAGLYRIEGLDRVQLNLSHKATEASAASIAKYGTSGAIGVQFVADQQVTGAGGPITILGTFGSATVSNTTKFFGPGNIIGVSNPTVEDASEIPIPVAGKIQYLTVSTTTDNSATGTTTVKVRKNGVDTASAVTILPVTGSGDVNGRPGAHYDPADTSFSVAAGDTVDWSALQSDSSTSGAMANIMSGFVPTTGNTVLLWGNFNVSDFNNQSPQTTYVTIFNGQDTGGGVEATVAYTLPRGGTASKWLIVVRSDAGPSTDTFTLRKNGADTAMTCVLSNGVIGVATCDSTHTVTFVAGDTVDIKAVIGGNAGPLTLGGWAMAFD